MLHLNQQQPVFSLRATPDFALRFSQLLQNFGAVEQEPEVLVSSRLYELVSLMLTNCQNIEYSPINQAIQYINQHYTEELSIKTLANLSQLSPSRFSAVFKKVTDCSPYQYVINTRLHAACQYLNCSDLSVGEIALKVGFSDDVPFINAFKRKHDVTPYQFRKRTRNLTMNKLLENDIL